MDMKLKFTNVCTACGTSRRKEDLVYDLETFKPYCTHMGICDKEKHPNGYTNFIARGNKELPLVTFKEAQDKFQAEMMERLTPDQLEIFKLTHKPTTVRLGEFDLAAYVVGYKTKKGHSTLTDALQAIIQEHKNLHDNGVTPEVLEKGPAPVEPEPEPEPQPPVVLATPLLEIDTEEDEDEDDNTF